MLAIITKLQGSLLILVTIIVVMIFSTIVALFSRYKKCPSDKILVVYGKVGKNKEGSTRSAKCIHGGAAFIWPIIQDYSFLDLKPISIEVMLQSALSRQNIRVDVPSIFTVAISTEPSTMQNAAERLFRIKARCNSSFGKGHNFWSAKACNSHNGN